MMSDVSTPQITVHWILYGGQRHNNSGYTRLCAVH